MGELIASYVVTIVMILLFLGLSVLTMYIFYEDDISNDKEAGLMFKGIVIGWMNCMTLFLSLMGVAAIINIQRGPREQVVNNVAEYHIDTTVVTTNHVSDTTYTIHYNETK